MTETNILDARTIAFAEVLGYGGLLPFVFGAALVWHPSTQAIASVSLLAYAAVILSFVGAVHWGLVLGTGGDALRAQLLWSVLPALAGWVFLLLPRGYAMVCLAAALAVFWAKERLHYANALPAWYLRLRTRLTTVAAISLLAGWAGLSAAG